MQVKEAAEVARDGVSIDEMMKQASARRMLMLELLSQGLTVKLKNVASRWKAEQQFEQETVVLVRAQNSR